MNLSPLPLPPTSAAALVAPLPASSATTHRAVTLAGGTLLVLSSALALRGLFQIDALATAPFEKSPALPHLALLVTMNTRQAVLTPDIAQRIVPGALIVHAVLIGLATALGGFVSRSARHAAWAPWLLLALGAISFYGAHFSFVHPGAQLENAGALLLLADFIAATGLGLGLWACVRFFTRFPTPFAMEAYGKFQVARFAQGEAEGAASRFAWRRWLARRQREGRAKNTRAERWRASLPLRLQAALAAPFLGTLTAAALASALLSPLRRGDLAPLASFAAMLMAILALTLPFALSFAVLAWHTQDGAPDVRRNARLLLHGLTATLALLPLGMLGGMTIGAVTENWRIITLSMFTLPVGVLLVMFVALVLLGITTWRATASGSPRPVGP